MAQLTAVLAALQALCAEGQVMVDLFVNYDCDLQAANLFERSMKGLSKLLRKSPPTSMFAAQQASKTKDVALDAVLAILKSLNSWAEPLKVRCCHSLPLIMHQVAQGPTKSEFVEGGIKSHHGLMVLGVAVWQL